MKAVYIEEYGEINNLNWGEVADPVQKNDEVTVKIRSTSINHLDIWVRKGIPRHKIDDFFILGSDASGEIVNKGSSIQNYNIGDKVVIQPGIFNKKSKFYNTKKSHYCSSYGIIGETTNGVQSEYFCCPIENICRMPEHLTFQEASSMPLVFITAYEMLISRAQLTQNDRILIYGGTSGIGSAAIQVAKDIGCKIFTTVGNNQKIDFAYNLGADFVINHRESFFYERLKESLKGEKFDVIFEHIGKTTWNSSLKFLDRGGRLVTCGATTGNIVQLDLTHLFFKNQSILGSTMASLETFNKVMKKISDKKYKPVIDKIFNIKDVKLAHDRLEKGLNLGKIVLEI